MVKSGQLPSSNASKQKNKHSAHSSHNNNNRSPLQDLNTISVQLPKGCLRFFSKHPKSAPQNPSPFSRSTINNPPKQNVSNNISKLSNSSKTGSRRMPTICSTKVCTQNKKNNNITPPVRNVGSSKKNLKQVTEDESGKNVLEKSTPVNKLDNTTRIIATSSNTSTNTTTPPIQTSVSPEINCASSSCLRAAAVSGTKTPVCYAAGHIVSGVTDRRKCRARGILTVGQKDSGSGCINLNKIENGDGLELGVVGGRSRMSLLPFPAEASMKWLLSPCEEADEHRRCDFSDSCSSGNTSCARLSKITLLSPRRSAGFEGISRALSGEVGGSPLSGLSGKMVQKNRYDFTMESSPFSGGSLGSGNVIQTPQSESSSDSHVGTTCLNTSANKMYDFEYDFNCATEDLLRSSMSPKISRSIWGSPGFSFRLPEFVSPSNSIDLSLSPNSCTNGCSCASNSRSKEISTSHMRVSWRDGLASQIFEMDESDICRCLSDDESDIIKNSNGKLKSGFSREMKDNMGDSENCGKEDATLEFVGDAPKYDEEREKDFDMKRSNPCEESICTDGGGLAASGDSDWTSCYKNQLFEL